MVSLRPHHPLCVLTYVGEGYGPDFVDNCDRIARRLAAGERVLVVDGPDDLCAPVLDRPGSHCRGARVDGRDARAAASVASVLGREVAAGTVLDLGPPALRRLRAAFASGDARHACDGCDWSGLCTAVAARGFAGARVASA